MAVSNNKNIGHSPYKVRRVMNLIRDKSVIDAKIQLQLIGTPPAREILKILNSAIANASNNEMLNESDLIVSKIFADGGPKLKRFKPKARGRAGAFDRPTSHITIEVTKGED